MTDLHWGTKDIREGIILDWLTTAGIPLPLLAVQPNEDPPPSLSGRVITLPSLADSEESPPLLTDSGYHDIPVQHSEDPPPSLVGGSMEYGSSENKISQVSEQS